MIGLEELKLRIRPVLIKHNIKKAGLFGSAARAEEYPNDLDILVKIENRISLLDFIRIKHELEDALEMKVDLVEYDALKPLLKETILKEEVPLL